jgi:hypothetical protein
MIIFYDILLCNVMYDCNDTAVMIIDIFQENKSTDYTTIVIVSLERTTWQFNMADWNPHVCFAIYYIHNIMNI